MSVWNAVQVQQLYELAFSRLLLQAATVHAQSFPHNEVELCSLLSIKTGGCPEDCAYCPQSAHYQTGVAREKLLSVEKIVETAALAKSQGAQRFCMGGAWRQPTKKDFAQVLAAIQAVKALGLETCVTLGMLTDDQAAQLKAVGLDYYNHNLDTGRDYYANIISTRDYDERLTTLASVQAAGINTCCGGILGMGESRQDRIDFLLQLTKLAAPPTSIPINKLIPIPGTPLANAEPIDNFEFIRTIAITRILFPNSMIRLSAGRETMSEEMHALCFLAGANSIFIGDVLLTMGNPTYNHDRALLSKLGLHATAAH